MPGCVLVYDMSTKRLVLSDTELSKKKDFAWLVSVNVG